MDDSEARSLVMDLLKPLPTRPDQIKSDDRFKALQTEKTRPPKLALGGVPQQTTQESTAIKQVKKSMRKAKMEEEAALESKRAAPQPESDSDDEPTKGKGRRRRR